MSPECVEFKKGMKWEYREGFYFVQNNTDCRWMEYQNNAVFGYYKLIKIGDDGESVVLFNEEDKLFVQLFNEQSFTGSKINKINRFLDAGKWIQNDLDESTMPNSCNKHQKGNLSKT